MKLMIPTIGVVIELTKPWTFALHREYRNHDFGKKAFGEDWRSHGNEAPELFTLPPGSLLKVDRIYLRQNKSEYDSVTFRLNAGVKKKRGEPKPLTGRFWVKLKDVNRIEGNIDHTTWPGMTELEILAMAALD